jgi:hypothetical protein
MLKIRHPSSSQQITQQDRRRQDTCIQKNLNNAIDRLETSRLLITTDNAIWILFNVINIGRLPRGEEEKLVSSNCDESDIPTNEDKRLDD